MFPKLLNICGNGCVRHFQNFRHTPVVHFDLKHLCIRVALRKFHNVLEVRAAPGVDRLRVVAHYHQVAMVAREQVHKVSLDFVGVLVFVHQNELKLASVDFRDPLVLLKHQQRFLKQVVKIHRVCRLLLFFVPVPNVLDFVEQRQEVRKFFRKQCLQRHLCVHDEAEDFRKHIAFRKPNFFWINSCARYHRIDQILLIFTIHDAEPARVTERCAVPAENPVSNRMERSAPKPTGIDREEIRDAIQHLAGSFVRERE